MDFQDEAPSERKWGRILAVWLGWAALVLAALIWLLSSENPSGALQRALVGAGGGYLLITWYRDWDAKRREADNRLRQIERQVREIRDILARLGH